MNIRFLNGPKKGHEFRVESGLILTRSAEEEGDIAIEEPLASNPHAEIIKKRGRFYLKDLDSKNGTFVEDKIQDLFVLEPGLRFQIGDSLFEVIGPPKPWQELVIKELEDVDVEDHPKNMLIIKPALILRFKSGLQKGEKWQLHYGPRKAGKASLDLSILDSEAPDICFVLEPQKRGVLFKTSLPEQVLLNKKHLNKQILKKGDLISFANTFIEIDYAKKRS